MKTPTILQRKALLSGLAIAITCGFTASCKKDNNNHRDTNEYVYLETNNPASGQNAILAYSNSGDGNLKPVSGSPFLTGGAGIANPAQALGLDDSDVQLLVSQDKKFLLAVNPGSNTISVFRIGTAGSLQAVPGSPFPSGGQTPVSLNQSGQFLYVVNKANDGIQAPNYTTLSISSEGSLSIVPGAAIATTPGSSPTQALLSNDKKFLFGADFLGFMATSPVGTLRSFGVNNDGTLSAVNGTPLTIPAKGGALGLWENPKENVLYVGFPLAGQIGIYTVATSGALSFQSMVNSGPAVCWLRTSKDGNYLYALNSGENSISVFNSSNPTTPSSIQKLTLKDSGPVYMAMGLPFATSEDFSLELSDDQNSIFVISQYTNPDFSLAGYNYLHVLKRATDGSVSEPSEPVQLPVANTTRPQGVAVYQQQ